MAGKGKIRLPALQRHGFVRTHRKGDVRVGALELRGLERLHVVDGLGEPLAQFLKGLSVSGVDGTSLWVTRGHSP